MGPPTPACCLLPAACCLLPACGLQPYQGAIGDVKGIKVGDWGHICLWDSNGVTLTAPRPLFGVVYTVEPAWVGSCRVFAVSDVVQRALEPYEREGLRNTEPVRDRFEPELINHGHCRGTRGRGAALSLGSDLAY